jgi:hypothetical protein
MNNVISLFRQGPMPRNTLPRGASLSVGQRKKATEIVSQFDPKNDSVQTRREMRDALRDADIRPGEDLRTVLKEAGFKVTRPPKEDDDQGFGPEVPRRKPRHLGPPPGLPSFVTSYLEQHKSGDVSETDTNEFMAKVRQMAPPPRGIFVNVLA